MEDAAQLRTKLLHTCGRDTMRLVLPMGIEEGCMVRAAGVFFGYIIDAHPRLGQTPWEKAARFDGCNDSHGATVLQPNRQGHVWVT